jgi:hypothetical protein
VRNYILPALPGPKAVSGDSIGVADFKLKARRGWLENQCGLCLQLKAENEVEKNRQQSFV